MKFAYIPLIGIVVLVYSIIAIGGGALIKDWREPPAQAATTTPPPTPAPVTSPPVSSAPSSGGVSMKLPEAPVIAQPACPQEPSGMQAFLDKKFFTIPMVSKDHWSVRWHDIFLLFGLITLFLETLRSTGTGDITVVNHILSMGVFVICIIEFLIVRGFATSTFFFLMIMALIDVVAGFVISLKSARRDIGFAGGGGLIAGDH